MSRIRRHASFSVIVALGAAIALAGTAFASPTFAGAPGGGTGRVANWSWDNGDPAIAPGASGSLQTVLVSDTLAGMCFGTNSGAGQVGVFYSRLASGATTWTKPKKMNGAYNADRGTLATSGSNVYIAWSKQIQYYDSTCKTLTFDTSQPRQVYFRRSTDNGVTWGTAIKLPGQSTSFRGDYNYIAANGTNVYVTTTDVSTGHILLWISTNSGMSFANPINLASTTFVDNTPGQTGGACPCGYTGGFTGLPAVATNGSAIGIAYASDANTEKILICSTAGTGCTSTTVASSGVTANAGYSQAAGDQSSNRMVFTWTTGGGAFSDVWTGGTGGSFGGVKTITTFPDANFAATACASSTTACNQGGEGAIPVLLGTTGIGISLSECNTVSSVTCDQSQTLLKSRAINVWYQSSDNGATYPTHALIQTATGASANVTWMNEFGSIANLGGTPYVLIAAHTDTYGAYDVEVKKCTGC